MPMPGGVPGVVSTPLLEARQCDLRSARIPDKAVQQDRSF